MTTVTPPADSPRKRTLRRAKDVVAEVEFFLAYTTDNTYSVARILGVHRESLKRAVRDRGERPDLWARLEARDVSMDPEEWYSRKWLPESDPRRHRRGDFGKGRKTA